MTRIRSLIFRGFQQFRRCTIDLTGPDGQPVDRVCLIGRNGTGKSTILAMLYTWLRHPSDVPEWVGVELEMDGGTVFLRPDVSFLLSGVPRAAVEAAYGLDSFDEITAFLQQAGAASSATRDVVRSLHLPLRSPRDLLVYCPAEAEHNAGPTLGGMPVTRLDDALKLFAEFPPSHVVSSANIAEMWRVLIYHVKRRENDRQTFELRPENLERTKAELIREFDAANPPVLERLATLWNHVLAPAGLEFDVAAAKVPIQLTENLEAWIVNSETRERVSYGALSSGTRNFVFRIGHLLLLYFNRRVERSFVLVDEPEASLFPDFLFELMKVYEEILRDSDGTTRAQVFMATHSPIIAAQFEPWERVVLEFGEDGGVTAGKGTAPKGDDPNDLLRKDFHLAELMGEVGIENWSRYLELRRQLRRVRDAEKPALVAEAADIALRYGFEPPR